MKAIILQVFDEDSKKDLLLAFDRCQNKDLYLLIDNNPLFTKQAFLMVIKEYIENGQAITIVQPKRLARSIAEQADVPVAEYIPEALSHIPIKSLFQFFSRVKARKTQPLLREQNNNLSTSEDLPYFSTHPIEQSNRQKSLRSRIFFLLIGAVLFFSLLLWWIAPSATIILKGRVTPLSVTQNVIIALAGSTVDKAERALPQITGILVETSVLGRESYPSTQIEYEIENAQGLVVLFNETTRPKTFVPSRLVTESGEVFRFSETVVIPPADGETPGSLPVSVIADEFDESGEAIGRRGNIAAGTRLDFAALSPESQELYYARANLGSLVRGDTLERRFVSELDPERAREAFIETYSRKAQEQLQLEIQEGAARSGEQYIFIDDPMVASVSLEDFVFPTDEIGLEKGAYEVFGSIRLSGVMFEQSALIEALQQQLELNRDPRMTLLNIDPESLDYRLLNADSFLSDGWVKLSVSMVGAQILDLQSNTPDVELWKQELKRAIRGANTNEAKRLLANYNDVEEVLKIRIRPFWVKTLPTILEQINLEVVR